MRTVLRLSLAVTAAVLSACGGTTTSAPSGIGYPHDPAIYMLGEPAYPNLPTVTGTGLSWSVSPALPAGLSLDAATGAISGTPAAIRGTAGYTITASNAGGGTTTVLDITVIDRPPCPFAYVHPVEDYETGRPVRRSNAPSFTSGPGCSTSMTGFAVEPFAPGASFPAGLSFDARTGDISGTPTSQTPASYFTVTATSSGGSARKGIRIAVYDPPASSLSVPVSPRNLQPQSADFYDEVVNWPVDQSKWGFCETASTSGLVGYARFGGTNKVSPLFTLFHAYDNPEFFPQPAGAHQTQSFYFWYDPLLGALWNFIEYKGLVRFPGTPDFSQLVFVNFWGQIPEGVPSFLPTRSTGLEGWNAHYESYQSELASHTAAVTTVPMRSLMLDVGTSTEFSGASLSARIADALDKGYLVQLMWKILVFDVEGVADEAYYYGYDHSGGAGNGALTRADPIPYCPAKDSVCKNNTYALGRPYNLGGDHWVYLFSYATDPGDGSRVFFVRNSWGGSNGENGNYYMADNFIDGSYPVMDGDGSQSYDLEGNPVTAKIVSSPHAMRILAAPPP